MIDDQLFDLSPAVVEIVRAASGKVLSDRRGHPLRDFAAVILADPDARQIVVENLNEVLQVYVHVVQERDLNAALMGLGSLG